MSFLQEAEIRDKKSGRHEACGMRLAACGTWRHNFKELCTVNRKSQVANPIIIIKIYIFIIRAN
jgi:hypothetical protein